MIMGMCLRILVIDADSCLIKGGRMCSSHENSIVTLCNERGPGIPALNFRELINESNAAKLMARCEEGVGCAKSTILTHYRTADGKVAHAIAMCGEFKAFEAPQLRKSLR